MTPEQFISKWEASTLTERAASHSHFNDLCEVLGVEKPTDADQKGTWYCFERGAAKTAGGDGWADVWKRNHFGWEYKGKRKDLKAAYSQLQQYAVALENPPLLVVSDMSRFVIHTNWTNTVSETHEIHISDLADPSKRDMLRSVFTDPERLKPSKTIGALTAEAANKFADLAIALRLRGHDADAVAHFVNRLVFCMFAEDTHLLPKNLFSAILEKGFEQPLLAEPMLGQLFKAMQSGGLFGVDAIEWFNGGLFDDASALPLTREDLKSIAEAAAMDWSDIDPSIAGTLFERGLDPEKRTQLGAHYTDPDKILAIVKPVVVDPLLNEWEVVKGKIAKSKPSAKQKQELLARFLERLRNFRVLDPACGSGNFLYLALLSLKDLEHRVGLEAEALGLGRQFPTVGPEAVLGIEINPFAAELARVTVWIGEIQWMRKNGFEVSRKPILKSLNNIARRDALLNDDGSEAEWPVADAIVGNPPFLGSRKLAPELGDEYVARLRRVYKDRVPRGADLVCFWFAKAWQAVRERHTSRAGLIATSSISGGASRNVLEPIAKAKALFHVLRDQPWVVEGAAVEVSLICFQGEAATTAILNGEPVDAIYADLHAASEVQADLGQARKLVENAGVAFQGIVPRGSLGRKAAKKLGLPPATFVTTGAEARAMFALPTNPNGESNAKVVVPYLNGDDITKRPKNRYIVDFTGLTEEEAALFEGPFTHIEGVQAHRAAMTQGDALEKWWLFWRTRADMRRALEPLPRFIVTPRVSKHRVFVWKSAPALADNMLVAIAKSDDTTFGILQSRHHRLWALRMGTRLENRPRYTSTTTFSTFPFPVGLTPNIEATAYQEDPRAIAIAAAARKLNQQRENWLNPPELVKEIRDAPHLPPRLEAIDASALAELKKRTLTNLYNMPPTWLSNAHRDLDEAVSAAYGWSAGASDDDIIQLLLAENIRRAAEQILPSGADQSDDGESADEDEDEAASEAV